MSEAFTAVGLVAAVVAVWFAWRSAVLAQLERRARALRGVADGVDEVRRTARQAVASNNESRSRVEQSEASAAFRRAQSRLELALAAGPLPRWLARDDDLRRALTSLRVSRPVGVGGPATRVLTALADAQRELTGPPRMRNAWRRLADLRDRPLEEEAAPRPGGGWAVRTGAPDVRIVEVVRPAGAAGLVHWWRPAEGAGVWARSEVFAASLAVDAVAVCLDAESEPPRLEIVARAGDRLYHVSRSGAVVGGAGGETTRPEALPLRGATGVPAIIKGGFGNDGNLEVVTPLASGGIGHVWRNDDADRRPWRVAKSFGPRGVDAVALVHGDLEDHHLEVIARRGTRLMHYWRDNASPSGWHHADGLERALEATEHRAAGAPGFIQSRRRGSRGNFEVVTPREGGGAVHLWRDNDRRPFPWRLRVLDDPVLLEAATIFEGDEREDGTRDLLILGHGWTALLDRRDPQPLPRRGRRQAGAAVGSRSRSSAPPPGAATAVTAPPWASAAWRTIASPSPEPGVRRAEAAR